MKQEPQIHKQHFQTRTQRLILSFFPENLELSRKALQPQIYYLFQPMTQELFLLCLFNSRLNTRISETVFDTVAHTSPLWKIDLYLDESNFMECLAVNGGSYNSNTTDTSVGSANITVIFILIWIGCNMPRLTLYCVSFHFHLLFYSQMDQTLMFAKPTLNTRIKYLANVFVLSPQHGQSSRFAGSKSADLYTC